MFYQMESILWCDICFPTVLKVLKSIIHNKYLVHVFRYAHNIALLWLIRLVVNILTSRYFYMALVIIFFTTSELLI